MFCMQQELSELDVTDRPQMPVGRQKQTTWLQVLQPKIETSKTSLLCSFTSAPYASFRHQYTMQ